MTARRLFRLLAAPAATAAVAIVPAAAQAGVWTVPQTKKAIAVADAHWPQSPCKGREQITWTSATTMQDFAATAFPAQCAVTLNWREVATNNPSPGYLCSVLEHEFGHLAGLGHSTDVNNVMYPIVWHVVPDCAAAFPTAPAPEAAGRKTSQPVSSARSHGARAHR